jgi:hypothetical protein
MYRSSGINVADRADLETLLRQCHGWFAVVAGYAKRRMPDSAWQIANDARGAIDEVLNEPAVVSPTDVESRLAKYRGQLQNWDPAPDIDDQIYRGLLALYPKHRVAIAELCDGYIDPTGSLLGKVRAAHRGTGGSSPDLMKPKGESRV